MVNDVLLAPETYRVLTRVPTTWWDELEVKTEIATALGESATSVQKRLAHLITLRLVERRRRETITPTTEIRKVGR